MKTSPGSYGKADFGRAILMVALAFALVSTGCQKEDDLMSPVYMSAPYDRESGTNSDLNSRYLASADEFAVNVDNGNLQGISNYNIIKIDHVAGKSMLPDYTVIVRSDGMVIYDGHHNVRVQDRIVFRMSDITMPVLHEIFEQYSFYSIVPDFKIYPDMPVVYTTYQPNQTMKPRTIYDDCFNNPPKLILIRQSIENLLGIDKYVTIEWKTTRLEPSL